MSFEPHDPHRPTVDLAQPRRAELQPTDPEPPVVARLIVEVRSDGRTTIARGAIDDKESGISVGLEAKGSTPMQLAASMAASILKLPLLALMGLNGPRMAQAARGLLLTAGTRRKKSRWRRE